MHYEYGVVVTVVVVVGIKLGHWDSTQKRYRCY